MSCSFDIVVIIFVQGYIIPSMVYKRGIVITKLGNNTSQPPQYCHHRTNLLIARQYRRFAYRKVNCKESGLNFFHSCSCSGKWELFCLLLWCLCVLFYALLVCADASNSPLTTSDETATKNCGKKIKTVDSVILVNTIHSNVFNFKPQLQITNFHLLDQG